MRELTRVLRLGIGIEISQLKKHAVELLTFEIVAVIFNPRKVFVFIFYFYTANLLTMKFFIFVFSLGIFLSDVSIRL